MSKKVSGARTEDRWDINACAPIMLLVKCLAHYVEPECICKLFIIRVIIVLWNKNYMNPAMKEPGASSRQTSSYDNTNSPLII